MTRLILLLVCGLMAFQAYALDRRAYQHGVDIIKLPDGGYRLFWSSSPGSPPEGINKPVLPNGVKCEHFTHDIFISTIDVKNPVVKPTPLIQLQEAQEPASVAVSSVGSILVTFEDGSQSDVVNHCKSNIQQRYQVFDSSLQPLTKLKTAAVSGGYSGHVTAVGEQFVIAYAEGWEYGGGIDEAGTANDIHVDVLDSRGIHIRHREIAVDNGLLRDWWPLIAGSKNEAILVWQRYVPGKNYANLMYSVYDPVSDRIIKQTSLLKSGLSYYHYDVRYLPNIDRFLVVGNYLANALLPSVDAGTLVTAPRLFAFLLDTRGNVISQWNQDKPCARCGSYHHYNLVREAQPAILEDNAKIVKLLYPAKPNGVVVFQVSGTSIVALDYKAVDHYWFPLGTDGIFLDEETAYFVNLTPLGLKTVTVKINQ